MSTSPTVSYLVWIEMDKAKVFNVSSDNKEPHHYHKHEHKHHNSHDEKNHKDSEKFFHEVAEHVKDAGELLLVGPGLAKNHFQDHLERHHAQLAKKIVGVKAMDITSDAQLLAFSREFFKKFDSFGAAATH